LNNVQQSDLQLNQAWIFAERKLQTRRGFDIGGRADVVFGTDARYTQSAGLEYRPNSHPTKGWGEGDYYVSFAQLYGEVGSKNISVKVGKFLTPLGYESTMSPERFFYSLGYAFSQLPATHTGGIATWTPSDRLSVIGGWANGADLTFYNEKDNAGIFGFQFAATKKISLAYNVILGQDKAGGKRDYLIQSAIVQFKPSDRWGYTFEWTLNNSKKDSNEFNGGYGINQELIYHLNQKWALGGRIEWMHGYNTVITAPSRDDVNQYGYTLGLNWTPRTWLVVRPEIRYDKIYGDSPFNTNHSDHRSEQFSSGCSAIVKF